MQAPERFHPTRIPPALDALIDAADELIDENHDWYDNPVAMRATWVTARLWEKGFTIVSHRELLASRISSIAILISLGIWIATILLTETDPIHIASHLIPLVLGTAVGAIAIATWRPRGR